MEFNCTVYDFREGKVHISVDADNEDLAYE